MGIDIDKVVVFDDNDPEALARASEVRSLVADMATGPNALFTKVPEVVGVHLRTACVDELNAVAERGGRAILVADLMSVDGTPKGARLLRAAATHTPIRKCTWRVAWTQRSSPVVAEALKAAGTHAMVVYARGQVDRLRAGIVHAVKSTPAEPGPFLVSPTDALETHSQRHRRYISQFLPTDKDRKRYTEALFWLVEAPTDSVGPISEDGTYFETKGPEVSAKSLIAYLRRRHASFRYKTPEEIEAELGKVLRPYSNSGLDQFILPTTVNMIAAAAIVLDDDAVCNETWLSESELRLARRFLSVARPLVTSKDHGLRADKTESFDLVNELLKVETFAKLRDTLNFVHTDTSHVIWTVYDWVVDREEAARIRKAEQL